jgi:hypothetical protein
MPQTVIGKGEIAKRRQRRRRSTECKNEGAADRVVRAWTCGRYEAHGSEDLVMKTVRFVYWEQDDVWIGYLQDYPDYWTQGETLDDLKDHLRDLYRDLSLGAVSGIRKVEELVVS